MSYAQQFIQGIRYRSRFEPAFKLDDSSVLALEQTFSETAGKAMDEPYFSIRQNICTLAQRFAADRSTEPFAYQCLADSHTFLQACVEQNILHEHYMTLTVGDVSIDGERMFDVSRTTIENAISQGISTVDEPAFHVWLTLVDMTVIDLTIIGQMVAQNQIAEPADPVQWLNVWRPERKGRFDYHPVLTDNDFLKRLQRRAH